MLTLLPGDESTTWNDDIVSWWSLHLSVREKGRWHTLHFGIVLIMFTVWHTQRQTSAKVKALHCLLTISLNA